ncbi:MAG TPA: nitroreductase family protein [Kribbella sp.]|nr:nitroreductase family protein [Kribbella sp.]
MNTTSVLTDDEVGILLTAAVHAPSIHNTQPWRFEVHGPVIDVLLDEQRTLPVADPSGRAARIGIGAAVFNIRVAAAMLCHESRVASNPDPHYPEMAARIFLAARAAPVPGLSGLYGEVRRRHTYRGPLLDRAVSPKVLQKLDEAARDEGAQLHWLDQGALTQLGEVLRRTDTEDLQDEDRLHERLRWIGGDRSGDGIQQSAVGPRPTRSSLVRDLSAGFDSAHRIQAVYEPAPAIAVLSTREEHTDAWVRAGLALQRVLLVATSYDLTASFLNQVLERTAPRYQVRDLIGGRTWPQMVIRIGYPAQSSGRTPRRGWRDSFDQWF